MNTTMSLLRFVSVPGLDGEAALITLDDRLGRTEFVVNRVLVRLVDEVFAAVDAGTPPAVADRALDPLGLPMRPLTLVDLIGPAVAAHICGILHAAFPDRNPTTHRPQTQSCGHGADRGG